MRGDAIKNDRKARKEILWNLSVYNMGPIQNRKRKGGLGLSGAVRGRKQILGGTRVMGLLTPVSVTIQQFYNPFHQAFSTIRQLNLAFLPICLWLTAV